MKATAQFRFQILIVAAALLLISCTSPDKVGVTNQEQPGPVIGRGIGVGVGAVVGNVVGGIVGMGEGFCSATKSAFDNTQRVVRHWKEEKTTDGRIILVSENYLVNEDGRVIRQVQ